MNIFYAFILVLFLPISPVSAQVVDASWHREYFHEQSTEKLTIASPETSWWASKAERLGRMLKALTQSAWSVQTGSQELLQGVSLGHLDASDRLREKVQVYLLRDRFVEENGLSKLSHVEIDRHLKDGTIFKNQQIDFSEYSEIQTEQTVPQGIEKPVMKTAGSPTTDAPPGFDGRNANDPTPDNGEGTQTLSDGSRYVGSFVNGARHGWGVMTYPGGVRYEGEWQANLWHGQGTRFGLYGQYTGGWRAQRQHGFGLDVGPKGHTLMCEFSDGKLLRSQEKDLKKDRAELIRWQLLWQSDREKIEDLCMREGQTVAGNAFLENHQIEFKKQLKSCAEACRFVCDHALVERAEIESREAINRDEHRGFRGVLQNDLRAQLRTVEQRCQTETEKLCQEAEASWNERVGNLKSTIDRLRQQERASKDRQRTEHLRALVFELETLADSGQRALRTALQNERIGFLTNLARQAKDSQAVATRATSERQIGERAGLSADELLARREITTQFEGERANLQTEAGSILARLAEKEREEKAFQEFIEQQLRLMEASADPSTLRINFRHISERHFHFGQRNQPSVFALTFRTPEVMRALLEAHLRDVELIDSARTLLDVDTGRHVGAYPPALGQGLVNTNWLRIVLVRQNNQVFVITAYPIAPPNK